MKKLNVLILVLVMSILGCNFGCSKKDARPVVWIYTSLYKDTVSEMKQKLEKDFPDVEIKIYQAGSEEVAAKVEAEKLAGKIQADILISSDRFWYEDMAQRGNLIPYHPVGTAAISTEFKSPSGMYTGVSLPVMVIAYNSEVVSEQEAPKSFLELKDVKWKDKISSGSPMASGTSFTTVAFLSKKYGWDYYQSLRSNNIISEGGNSGVIRRLQSKERPVGIVLLENIMRLKESDPRIKMVIPSDGVVIHSNVLAIVKKDGDLTWSKKISDWMFSQKGQETMVNSFMYATMPGHSQPKGAPLLTEILKTAMPWTNEFISETMKSREEIKNRFSKIVF